MRVAGIDMGSNSFLLLIVKFDSFGNYKVEQDLLKVVRLGEGVDDSGRFSEKALARALRCLKDFKDEIKKHNVDWVEAVTTSAARRVSNFEDLKSLTEQLQIPLKVIQGEEEARLTYLGATEKNSVVVVDVGGGSTEVVTNNQEKYSCYSFEFGSVRLLEKHITKQPLIKSEQNLVEQEIKSKLSEQKKYLKNFISKPVVAVAGTPTTLAAIMKDTVYSAEKIEGITITCLELESWIHKLSKQSVDQRMEYKALQGSPGRADVIVMGLMCLYEVLKHIQATEFTVSTKGVRYGLVKDIFTKHSYVLADQ